jgi:hypothetical protein
MMEVEVKEKYFTSWLATIELNVWESDERM